MIKVKVYDVKVEHVPNPDKNSKSKTIPKVVDKKHKLVREVAIPNGVYENYKQREEFFLLGPKQYFEPVEVKDASGKGDGLDKLKRADLDKKALELNIDPQDFKSKGDLIAEIRKVSIEEKELND